MTNFDDYLRDTNVNTRIIIVNIIILNQYY